MKTVTCKQLGGPCELPLSGSTADEVIKAQDRHLKEAVPCAYFMDQVLWPQLEIYHLLKSGSRVIKLHDAEVEAPLLALGLTRIIYPEEMQG